MIKVKLAYVVKEGRAALLLGGEFKLRLSFQEKSVTVYMTLVQFSHFNVLVIEFFIVSVFVPNLSSFSQWEKRSETYNFYCLKNSRLKSNDIWINN